jgi:hypothetical protein
MYIVEANIFLLVTLRKSLREEHKVSVREQGAEDNIRTLEG